MILAPGAVIGGKYRLERRLATGGQGSVWVAQHTQLQAEVAIKLMNLRLASSPIQRARFEREARAMAQIRNNHIVNVQDYGLEGDLPFLVMELLRGEDLGKRLRREKRIALPDAFRILSQVGKGLRRAHEAGLVHRDLKPGNIFLAQGDEEEVVKILDFGIVKDTEGPITESTKTGELLGSPHYMSPEQIKGARDADARSDLWSLGVILYRALTGELPFPAPSVGMVIVQIVGQKARPPSEIVPGLPAAIDDFFVRAFARNRDERFQSVREMVAAFAPLVSGRAAMPSILFDEPSSYMGPAPPLPFPPPLQPVAVDAPASAPVPAPVPAPASEIAPDDGDRTSTDLWDAVTNKQVHDPAPPTFEPAAPTSSMRPVLGGSATSPSPVKLSYASSAGSSPPSLLAYADAPTPISSPPAVTVATPPPPPPPPLQPDVTPPPPPARPAYPGAIIPLPDPAGGATEPFNVATHGTMIMTDILRPATPSLPALEEPTDLDLQTRTVPLTRSSVSLPNMSPAPSVGLGLPSPSPLPLAPPLSPAPAFDPLRSTGEYPGDMGRKSPPWSVAHRPVIVGLVIGVGVSVVVAIALLLILSSGP